MARTPDATLAERPVEGEPWLRPLIEGEEEEECRLERRLGRAALGAFKPMADFDWSHPRKIDREALSLRPRVSARAQSTSNRSA